MNDINNLPKKELSFLNLLVAKAIRYSTDIIEHNIVENNIDLINSLTDKGFISINERTLYNVRDRHFSNGRIMESLKLCSVKFKDDLILSMGKNSLNNKNIKSGHDQIIYHFVEHLKKKDEMLYFSNFEIKTQYGVTRPDLYVLPNTNSFDELIPVCYEIKHSHNDFMTDIKKPSKRASYLEISSSISYVCPEGVIKIQEVPKECGLIYMLENGEFKEIIKAPVNNQWKNNFDQSLLLRLIKHKNISKIKLFINESSGINSRLKTVEFESAFTKEKNILMSQKHYDVLLKLRKRNNMLRNLSLFEDDYGIMLDLIGLGIIKESYEKEDRAEEELLMDFLHGMSFDLTQKGDLLKERLINFQRNIQDLWLTSQREFQSKFVYRNLHLAQKKIFDYYSFNENKYFDKINATGLIKIYSKEDMKNFLKDEKRTEKLFNCCQKFAFLDETGEIKKKDIPSEIYLYARGNYSYSKEDLGNEKKRGVKRSPESIDKDVFVSLLKQEYNNGYCFSFD